MGLNTSWPHFNFSPEISGLVNSINRNTDANIINNHHDLKQIHLFPSKKNSGFCLKPFFSGAPRKGPAQRAARGFGSPNFSSGTWAAWEVRNCSTFFTEASWAGTLDNVLNFKVVTLTCS